LQNARLWVLYNRISERRAVDGRKFEPEVWHEHYKRSFLGMVDIELPGGEVVTRARSTKRLDVAEFNDYMTQVEVDAAEHGVYLDE
jgi:hypothetical protein